MSFSFRTGVFTAAAVAGAIVTAVPAAATVETFAQYNQLVGGNTVRFIKQGTAGGKLITVSSSNSNSTTAQAVAVDFRYLLPSLASLGSLAANYTLSLTETNTPATFDGSMYRQGGLSGTFSFLSRTAFTIGTTTYAAGTNLLSGSIGPAMITGGGTSGGVASSTAGGATISYTSDVLDFKQGSNYDFALTLTQVNPVFGRANASSSLNSFRAASTGSFSSDPAPTVIALPPVPEPATWGMMVVGFSLMGHQMRRRRTERATAL